ncbi:MAG TPA: B-box zinc finger protein [Bryobacteraceae bacterium]|nr:B-box zinc finger protein [Bryobacteraceae bacterium]
MNCANHPETQAVSFCRTCGKPLCGLCEHRVSGTVYCDEHAAAASQFAAPPPGPTAADPGQAAAYSPYTAPYRGPQDASASPGLAFLLGLIPGVGAIYNGQYAKGLVHVVIFGALISLLNSDSVRGMEPVFALLLVGWYFYMPFEAYHTASKRAAGQPVDEFSSLVPLRSRASNSPAAPIALILIGVFFLLNNLGLIRLYQIMRFWPVVLIVVGVYLLWARLRPSPNSNQTVAAPPSEVLHER